MKSLQLVVVATFTFSLLETGASQCDVVRLAAAVHETLSPFMTEMKQELAFVKTELRAGLAQVKENLTNLNMVKSLLISVNTSMSEGLSAVKNTLKEHSSQTASEL
ncbi:hypothetical protein GBAR_LOCUS27246, partial [Geodia barretti]